MLSVQSMMSTLGIGLLVVWVVDWVGSPVGDWGGDSNDVKGRLAGMERAAESASLVNVNPLCNGWPICVNYCGL